MSAPDSDLARLINGISAKARHGAVVAEHGVLAQGTSMTMRSGGRRGRPHRRRHLRAHGVSSGGGSDEIVRTASERR